MSQETELPLRTRVFIWLSIVSLILLGFTVYYFLSLVDYSNIILWSVQTLKLDYIAEHNLLLKCRMTHESPN